MHGYQERPDTRLERYLIIGLAIGLLLGLDRLAALVMGDWDQPRPGVWVGIAVVLGLLLYLSVLLVALVTARYAVEGGRLVLHHALRQAVVIQLDGRLHLHRWRTRWTWSGGPVRDLGIEEIDHLPPVWVERSTGVWVLVGTTPQGQQRAVAFSPSPRLLALLKERVAEQRAV